MKERKKQGRGTRRKCSKMIRKKKCIDGEKDREKEDAIRYAPVAVYV